MIVQQSNGAKEESTASWRDWQWYDVLGTESHLRSRVAILKWGYLQGVDQDHHRYWERLIGMLIIIDKECFTGEDR